MKNLTTDPLREREARRPRVIFRSGTETLRGLKQVLSFLRISGLCMCSYHFTQLIMNRLAGFRPTFGADAFAHAAQEGNIMGMNAAIREWADIGEQVAVV